MVCPGPQPLKCTACLINVQVEDSPLSLPQLLRTGRGRLTVAAELAGLAAMLPFLWIELCTFAVYGLAWLADAWRLLGLATYALQVGITGRQQCMCLCVCVCVATHASMLQPGVLEPGAATRAEQLPCWCPTCNRTAPPCRRWLWHSTLGACRERTKSSRWRRPCSACCCSSGCRCEQGSAMHATFRCRRIITWRWPPALGMRLPN